MLKAAIMFLVAVCSAPGSFAQVNFFQNEIESEVEIGNPKEITDSDESGPLHFGSVTTIFGNHRDTETKLVFWATGKWRMHFVFSNGNRYDAEDFVSMVRLFDRRGNQIGETIVIRQLVGATAGGKTKKKTVKHQGMLTPEEYGRFSYYEVTHFTTDRDVTQQLREGSEFLKSLREFSEEAAKLQGLLAASPV